MPFPLMYGEKKNGIVGRKIDRKVNEKSVSRDLIKYQATGRTSETKLTRKIVFP